MDWILRYVKSYLYLFTFRVTGVVHSRTGESSPIICSPKNIYRPARAQRRKIVVTPKPQYTPTAMRTSGKRSNIKNKRNGSPIILVHIINISMLDIVIYHS